MKKYSLEKKNTEKVSDKTKHCQAVHWHSLCIIYLPCLRQKKKSQKEGDLAVLNDRMKESL